MIRLFRFLLSLALIGPWASLAALGQDPQDAVELYTRHVKPLLRARCIACHGALKQEAGLRLDTVESVRRGGDSGPAIVVGDPASSRLVQRVEAHDLGERMPPQDEGEALTETQVSEIRAWIAAGAVGPAQEAAETDPRLHWAYQPVRVEPEVEELFADERVHPIDALLKLTGAPAEGRGPADRLTLLRRITFDLIGLPPTFEEIRAVEQASDESWYVETVERLLADPRYGQRWGRHWMDIWRYSDWWGLGDQLRNSQLHQWHWRDWIIDSLNQNVPYDEMIRQMLAADELYPHDLAKLRATGFLARNYFLFNRHQWMDEVVEHVGKGLLGVTLNCAKCHDHKYDPITQVDYYRMRAIFEPYHVRLDNVPGETDLKRDGIPRVFDGLLDAPTYRLLRGQETMPDRSTSLAPGVPAFLSAELPIVSVDLPAVAWNPARRPWVITDQLARSESSWRARRAELMALETQRDTAETDKTWPHRLQQAQWAERVSRAEWEAAIARAAAMRAEWAVHDAEGTDAYEPTRQRFLEWAAVAQRSERNAGWIRQQERIAELGRRIENASSDDERAKQQMEREAALEQAKRIATQWTEDGTEFTRFTGALWTPTRFVSSTADDPTVEFPRTSTGRRTALARWITDPANPLTARVAVNHIWMRHMGTPLVPTVFDLGRKGQSPTNPQLLDGLAAAWVARGWDMKYLHRMIVTSAVYRQATYGPSINGLSEDDAALRRHPVRMESQLVRDSVLALCGSLDCSLGGPPVPPAEQPASVRRSLYFFHSNNERNVFLATFDEALVKECYRRDQSVVPQQALAMINSDLALTAAPLIAKRIALHGTDDRQYVINAFVQMLGFQPHEAEMAAAVNAMQAWRGLSSDPSVVDRDEQARVQLVWSLLNHHDFVTLR